ncbi:dTDP-4-dehydrorhamnose reductase [Lentiprolixibacter aurantiacus]|uniref:dTDP-4-dehydrorhamnose reductase n=1 Tax=Lentiprolixibacter aurantiacus TaxID=2993939 RepID=A0AAE3MJU2_9FLAO|nr:dTDP-4-dehydrorhamnose reductase [Lentiprolixibacter aurantiacus]MCX2718538.1 dTDP-4-dehydrorhamnose reductase [Lentiprolixibacter aurantiacus]
MKRVLVTGSSGQLGMTLQELAPEYPEMRFHFTDKSSMDITRPEEVSLVFEQLKPDYCINCAAYTRVDQAEKEPDAAYELNVRGVKHLVSACKESNTVLIHISTDYVFDGTRKEGYGPEDVPNPINVYGKTKLEGEQLIQAHLDHYFIVRTSWLYSRKYGHNFYKTILAKAKAGEALTVTDKERGCPTDTVNLAKYLLDLIATRSAEYGIKHFSDGEPMTWYEFAESILNDNGYRDKADLQRGENYRTFAQRPVNSVLI